MLWAAQRRFAPQKIEEGSDGTVAVGERFIFVANTGIMSKPFGSRKIVWKESLTLPQSIRGWPSWRRI